MAEAESPSTKNTTAENPTAETPYPQRFTWHSAIAPQFPTEKQIEFLKHNFKIQSMRACSVPDAEGKLPEKPRKFFMGDWKKGDKAQVFLKRTHAGCREEHWDLVFQFLNFQKVENVQRNKSQALWRHYTWIYKDDVRSQELVDNCFVLDETQIVDVTPKIKPKKTLAQRFAARFPQFTEENKEILKKMDRDLYASGAGSGSEESAAEDFPADGAAGAAGGAAGAAVGGGSPKKSALKDVPASAVAAVEARTPIRSAVMRSPHRIPVKLNHAIAELGMQRRSAPPTPAIAETGTPRRSAPPTPAIAETGTPRAIAETRMPRRNTPRTPTILQQIQRTPPTLTMQRAGRAAARGLFGDEEEEADDIPSASPPTAARRGLFPRNGGAGNNDDAELLFPKKRGGNDDDDDEFLMSPPSGPGSRAAEASAAEPAAKTALGGFASMLAAKRARAQQQPPKKKKAGKSSSSGHKPAKKKSKTAGSAMMPPLETTTTAAAAAPAQTVVRRIAPRPGAASGGVVVTKIPATVAPPDAPPPPPLYEALFREFLGLKNVYVKGRTAELNMLGVIRALISREVFQNREHAGFFTTKPRPGLGLLYPTREDTSEGSAAGSSSTQEASIGPSTLELHRRALRLEWLAENLLAILRDSARSAGADRIACLADKRDRDDLEAAFRFHGGIPGQGADFWQEKPDGGLPRVPGAAAEEASLYPALREMQQLRPAAFARSYLVVDECSWGLPVAVRLLLARRHAVERGRKLDAADLVQEISSLNKRRVQAVVNDRAPLVKYGLRLTEYCLRLEAIVSALKMVVPSYLSPSGGTVPLFDARELRADDPDARPEYTGRRLQEEQADLRSALAALGMASSPAAEQIQRVRSAIAAAMAGDSHQRLATSGLHPSQSMPEAVYNPLGYV